jgi:hypothetical protein
MHQYLKGRELVTHKAIGIYNFEAMKAFFDFVSFLALQGRIVKRNLWNETQIEYLLMGMYH